MKLSVLLLSLFFLVTSFSSVQSNSHLYSTWDIMETDKLASIWLIKRFIDKDAEFRFYSHGELITEGIPFDVPQAELRVYHNLSTFESIVKKFKIDDPIVKQIAEIMHDIEINIWGKKLREESTEINDAVYEVINSSKGPEECITRNFAIFDQLYEELEKIKTRFID